MIHLVHGSELAGGFRIEMDTIQLFALKYEEDLTRYDFIDTDKGVLIVLGIVDRLGIAHNLQFPDLIINEIGSNMSAFDLVEKDALDRMEAILRRMEEEYEETQEADVRPNTVSYVTVRSRNYE